MTSLPIAKELLEAERQRLLRDHYEDTPPFKGKVKVCKDCKRARQVKLELSDIEVLNR